MRKWYAQQCDPYSDEELPEAPPALVNELSRRYIMLYEILTGMPFTQQALEGAEVNMNDAVLAYFQQ